MAEAGKIYTGLDLSFTGTGMVAIDKDANILEQTLIRTKSKEELVVRIKYIYEHISLRLTALTPQIIYVEGLAFARNTKNSKYLAGLHYYVLTNLWHNGYQYKETPPTQLKKFVTGKGQCKKDLMLMKTYRRWGIEFEDDNLCDAYCLARMALQENPPTTGKIKRATVKI